MNSNESKNRSRRRIRLPRESYDGPGLVTMVTIATRERFAAFANASFAHHCVYELRRTAHEQRLAVLAYCIMPDHLHFLARLDGDGNLIDIVRLYKGRTVRIAAQYQLPRGFWQRSFYDHLIRPDEPADKYMRYILENPVRSGIAVTVDDYEFVGSFEYEFEQVSDLLQ